MTETPSDKTPTMVEGAVAAAERLEKANTEMRLNIARLEELQTQRILGGKADAGKTEEKPVEVSAIEYAKAALQGKLLNPVK